MANKRPRVLCLSGHDPSGGAGIQADIEAVAALGGHALCVITAHTVQDTRNVAALRTAEPALFQAQIDAVLADAPVQSIKIGLLGHAELIPIVATVSQRASVPVVLDPVLRAGGGAELASPSLQDAMIRELLPRVDVLTPNAAEARRLAPSAASLDACAARLLAAGARNVLVTGGDEPGEVVLNSWHARGRAVRRFVWPRLPGPFHGAGCTLASAIAALLARGLPLAQALEDAQAYTHRSLEAAFQCGQGRKIPQRLP